MIKNFEQFINENLNEKYGNIGLSKVKEYATSSDKGLAIVSAERNGNPDNVKNTKELEGVIKSLSDKIGSEYTRTIGGWVENGVPVEENSFLILFDEKHKNEVEGVMKDMCKTYDQDAYLWCFAGKAATKKRNGAIAWTLGKITQSGLDEYWTILPTGEKFRF